MTPTTTPDPAAAARALLPHLRLATVREDLLTLADQLETEDTWIDDVRAGLTIACGYMRSFAHSLPTAAEQQEKLAAAVEERVAEARDRTGLRLRLGQVEGERDRARELAARLEERLTPVEDALDGLTDSRRRALAELTAAGA